MKRNLTAPIHIGNIATIGPGMLTVHTIFNEVTGDFKVSAIQMSVREGEIIDDPEGPIAHRFAGRRSGSVEQPADKIPAAILMQIEKLLDRLVAFYAIQEGYELRKG